MPNYTLNPTYYRVTWDNTAFPGLTGEQAGGLDGVSSWAYNEKINITGTVDVSGGVTADCSMLINNYVINLDNGDATSDIITKINLASQLTNVIAHDGIETNYITLTNASGHEGETIELALGGALADALAELGFTAGAYKQGLYLAGGAFTGLAAGQTFKINGFEFTAGADASPAGIAAVINASSFYVSVIAVPAGTGLQLVSTTSQPITTANGTGTVANLGFPAGVHAGTPATLEQSIEKERANARWQMVINKLEEFATPSMVQDFLVTGNFNGTAAPDTFSFTAGYDRPDLLSTADELNPGSMLHGSEAVRRAVARGLASTYQGNAKVFDPTASVNNNLGFRPNPARIVDLKTGPISTNLLALEAAISVMMIAWA